MIYRVRRDSCLSYVVGDFGLVQFVVDVGRVKRFVAALVVAFVAVRR